MKLSWILVLALASVLNAAPAAEDRTPEQRLAALGLTLPAVPASVANYVPAVRSGRLVFLAGQVARDVAVQGAQPVRAAVHVADGVHAQPIRQRGRR